MICPNCGKPIANGIKFCPGCGKSVIPAAAKPPVNGGQYSPNGNGGQRRPTGNGGQYSPNGSGGQRRPNGNGGQYSPNGNGGQRRPNGNGGQYGPNGNGGQRRPNGYGEPYDPRYNGPYGFDEEDAYAPEGNRGRNSDYDDRNRSGGNGRKTGLLIAILLIFVLVIGALLAMLLLRRSNSTESVDLFAGVELKYSGTDSDGTVEVVVDADEADVSESVLDQLVYTADPSKGLSIGDKITVTVETEDGDDPTQFLKKKYKLEPTRTEKTFTVKEGDLDAELADSAELSPDVEKAMIAEAVSAARASVNWKNAGIDDVVCLGSFFLTAKDGNSNNAKAPSKNMLILVDRVDVKTAEDESFSYYFYTMYKDVNGDEDYPAEKYEIPTMTGKMKRTRTVFEYTGYDSLQSLTADVERNYSSVYDIEERVSDDPREPQLKPTATPTKTPTPTPTKTPTPKPTRTPKPTLSPNDPRSIEGMVIPTSSTRYLTDADVRTLSKAQLQDAVNEIYARHGYIFSDAVLQARYDAYAWYNGTTPKASFNENVFNNVERENIKLLKKYINGVTPTPTPTATPTPTPQPTSAIIDAPSGDLTTEGLVFPDSCYRLLTTEDCAGLTPEMAQDAINDIYAQCGYIFTDPALQAKYARYVWYVGTTPASGVSREMFSDIEYANIQLLTNYL